MRVNVGVGSKRWGLVSNLWPLSFWLLDAWRTWHLIRRFTSIR